MRIRYKAFIMPHVGDRYSQCADRYALNPDKKCFAIADGVGNSLFPEIWSNMVCEDFCEHPDNFFTEEGNLVRESQLIGKWEELRDKRVSSLTEEEQFIYEMGLDKADFAACTFVGLTLSNSRWESSARGDSFIFFIDEKFEIVNRLASMDGDEFTNYPEYYASKKGQNFGRLVKKEGAYSNICYIALMTDALSDWFIAAAHQERESLLSVDTDQMFYSFVNSHRASQSLKDDDTTMVVLSLLQDDSDEISFEEVHVDKIDLLIEDENKKLKENETENALEASSSSYSSQTIVVPSSLDAGGESVIDKEDNNISDEIIFSLDGQNNVTIATKDNVIGSIEKEIEELWSQLKDAIHRWTECKKREPNYKRARNSFKDQISKHANELKVLLK